MIRLSKSADPASTSIERQREIIESYTQSQGMDLVDVAEDTATSAFRVPPERRKFLRQWLEERSDEFDAIVYWRQDRLVRRTFDFLGIVQWCQQHGKKLYSATEGLGDVTQHAGMLVGFITAWQAEGESLNTSTRVTQTNVKLAKEGRWRGGRVPYGFHPVCICHDKPQCLAIYPDKPKGWKLTPDERGTAPVAREAARRVIAGESVHAVAVDFNKRSIPATDGGLWQSAVLRKILANPALVSGILSGQEYGQLQVALKARSGQRTVKTLGRDSLLLDLVFCGECGGKVYRWHRASNGNYYGRCRNELKRGLTGVECRAPMVPYGLLEEAATKNLLDEHGDDVIETRVTDAVRRLRSDEIDRELIELAAELAAKRLDRAEFMKRQTDLLDEQEALERAERAPEWHRSGETVGQRWERLSDAERRLWLLRIGTTWSVRKEVRDDGAWRWRIESSWVVVDDTSRRERVVRA